MTDKFIKTIIQKISGQLELYFTETEVPIFEEFCTLFGYPTNFVLNISEENVRLKVLLDMMKTKKRASLERKIYNSEINATIGAQLMKSWREE
jgi:hypothetical protein